MLLFVCRYAHRYLNGFKSVYNRLFSDLHGKLSKMLLIPHVLVGILQLLQSEDLLVDDRVDVVRLDGTVHILKLRPGSYKQTSNSADIVL